MINDEIKTKILNIIKEKESAIGKSINNFTHDEVQELIQKDMGIKGLTTLDKVSPIILEYMEESK